MVFFPYFSIRSTASGWNTVRGRRKLLKRLLTGTWKYSIFLFYYMIISFWWRNTIFERMAEERSLEKWVSMWGAYFVQPEGLQYECRVPRSGTLLVLRWRAYFLKMFLWKGKRDIHEPQVQHRVQMNAEFFCQEFLLLFLVDLAMFSPEQSFLFLRVVRGALFIISLPASLGVPQKMTGCNHCTDHFYHPQSIKIASFSWSFRSVGWWWGTAECSPKAMILSKRKFFCHVLDTIAPIFHANSRSEMPGRSSEKTSQKLYLQ